MTAVVIVVVIVVVIGRNIFKLHTLTSISLAPLHISMQSSSHQNRKSYGEAKANKYGKSSGNSGQPSFG